MGSDVCEYKICSSIKGSSYYLEGEFWAHCNQRFDEHVLYGLWLIQTLDPNFCDASGIEHTSVWFKKSSLYYLAHVRIT